MVSTVVRSEPERGRASIVRNTPWMRRNIDSVLTAGGDDMTGIQKKEPKISVILGSGSKNLWPP